MKLKAKFQKDLEARAAKLEKPNQNKIKRRRVS